MVSNVMTTTDSLGKAEENKRLYRIIRKRQASLFAYLITRVVLENIMRTEKASGEKKKAEIIREK